MCIRDRNIRVKNLVMAALFTAIGVVLPQAFHMIPNAGSIILPMHIPVLICGMTVGGFYGAIAGALTVSLSILINGMPPLFPTGVCMIVELAVYGLVSGCLLYTSFIKSRIGTYLWSTSYIWLMSSSTLQE